MWRYTYSSELYHFGIKGQKWGVRRFETEDGHLTAAGKRRYLDSEGNLSAEGALYEAKTRQRLIKKYGYEMGEQEHKDRQAMSAEAYKHQEEVNRLKSRIDKLQAKRDATTKEKKLARIDKKMSRAEKYMKENQEKHDKYAKHLSKEELEMGEYYHKKFSREMSEITTAELLGSNRAAANAYGNQWEHEERMQRIKKRVGIDD